MNKEGTQADRPSILLTRRKEDKGAICMDGKAQPGQARTWWAGLGKRERLAYGRCQEALIKVLERLIL